MAPDPVDFECCPPPSFPLRDGFSTESIAVKCHWFADVVWLPRGFVRRLRGAMCLAFRSTNEHTPSNKFSDQRHLFSVSGEIIASHRARDSPENFDGRQDAVACLCLLSSFESQYVMRKCDQDIESCNMLHVQIEINAAWDHHENSC